MSGARADSVLFIGAGRMGALMAARLGHAGVSLAVADLDPAALEPFAQKGFATARQGVELPGDVVMTMLPHEGHVRDALLGPGGALVGQARALVIDMSTSLPAATIDLARDLSLRGTALVDAPVSGGMAGAEAGTLVAMVGGEAGDVERARPLLLAFSQSVTPVGPVGSGHIVKALNNFLSAVTLWSASEALVVGTRLGLDPQAMLDVWTKGSGRSHATEVKLPRHVLSERFDFGQSLDFFCKDIAIAADLAARADAATPALDATLANWRALAERLGGQEDITTVARYLAASARRDGPEK